MRLQPDSDFAEGIRAVLIDKDGSPKWTHANIDEVSTEVVESFFLPLEASHRLGEVDLQLV